MDFEFFKSLHHNDRIDNYPDNLVDLCKDTRYLSLLLYDRLLCKHNDCHDPLDFYEIYFKLNYFLIKPNFDAHLDSSFIPIALSVTDANLEGLLHALSLCEFGHQVLAALWIAPIHVLVEFCHAIATGEIHVFCMNTMQVPARYKVALPLEQLNLDAFLISIVYTAKRFGLEYMHLIKVLLAWDLAIDHSYLFKLIDGYAQLKELLSPEMAVSDHKSLQHFLEHDD